MSQLTDILRIPTWNQMNEDEFNIGLQQTNDFRSQLNQGGFPLQPKPYQPWVGGSGFRPRGIGALPQSSPFIPQSGAIPGYAGVGKPIDSFVTGRDRQMFSAQQDWRNRTRGNADVMRSLAGGAAGNKWANQAASSQAKNPTMGQTSFDNSDLERYKGV